MPSTGASPDRDRVLDAKALAAVNTSHFRSLPSSTLNDLLEEARRVHVPAGSIIHRVGDTAAHVEIVVSGLIRVFVTAPDGRTMTVRYCRSGSLIGVVSLFAEPFWLPASIQALTDADLLVLSPSGVRRAAGQDARMARALIDELSERVMSFLVEIPGGVFASVRQRVARHLLDLASDRQRGSLLSVTTTQQGLADAVGTVREVVVRTLRDLRLEGVLKTERDRILLLDPERLFEEAQITDQST